ncbi:MarR family winged helix-turn-helix transcriptional regulator [Paenibacillus sp. NPDC056579]|uniref:MarR family winged helix-turn-helix transcriptional regulator n=1 Tax=unclassified Paenibacillus TaxID=185978 RepID=UPI001EF9A1E7|nr:MarR family transcriptional regulator [Paenibacillus sp. H1-7]ULL15065.1 MarR family transcriptional regulator [Paenibacillus sp. H1-7]
MSRAQDASMLLKSLLAMGRQMKRSLQTIIMDPQLNNSTISVMFQLEHQSMKMNDIADYLTITLGAATSLVDKLERQNIVERIRSVEDRRIIYVQLTDTGKEKLNSLREHIWAEANTIFANLPEEQMQEYIQTVDRITRHLGEYNGCVGEKSCQEQQ